VNLGFPVLTRRLPRSVTAISAVRVQYPDGRGILRQALQATTARGFAVGEVSVNSAPDPDREPVTGAPAGLALPPAVEVVLQVHGKGSVNDLASVLTEIPGVRAVIADDANAAA
jgi:putative Mg2+ transporter-C (MgtC) family protein